MQVIFANFGKLSLFGTTFPPTFVLLFPSLTPLSPVLCKSHRFDFSLPFRSLPSLGRCLVCTTSFVMFLPNL